MPRPRKNVLRWNPRAAAAHVAGLTLCCMLFACTGGESSPEADADSVTPDPIQVLQARQAGAFTEACIWSHPTQADQGLVLAADEKSGNLFVFGFDGTALQSIMADKARGIDVRYNIPIGGDTTDIVAVVNTGAATTQGVIQIYSIDTEMRVLAPLGDGIPCGEGMDGGALTFSRAAGGLHYFACSSKSGKIEQYEITVDSMSGAITGNKVREWSVGSCGDILADDQAGTIFVAEPDKGVWKLHGAPQGETPGELTIKVGDHGLNKVGQLVMYKRREGDGYIMAADADDNKVHLYKRRAQNDYVGTFVLKNSPDNPAIAVVSAEIDSRFPFGMFVAGAAEANEGAELQMMRWEDIADIHGFNVDNSWDPRR